MDWFAVRRIGPGIWRVAEPGHVNSWLVEGTQSALLVDTGLGIFDVGAVVREITDLPVEVVNTHGHFDHIGGNNQFDRVAIHSAGVNRLGRKTPPEMLREYVEWIPGYERAFREQLAADEENFNFFTPDEWIRPLPQGFAPESWRIEPVQPARVLSDGDRFDLGGRTVDVLHTPGHTPDSVCLMLQPEGYLFTGDAVNSGQIWAHQIESDVETFANSTARLAALANQVQLVCMAHHMRAEIDGVFLIEVAELFAKVVAGDFESKPVVDAFGDPAILVRHERAGVYLPDPTRPRRGMFDDWSD